MVFISSLIPLTLVKPVSANPGLLAWTSVDTPSALSNVIASPSEINSITIGSDGHTFYAVDIPDINSSGSQGRLYKSEDGGITWPQELSAQMLTTPSPNTPILPVWNIAVAPDDVNFLVAITSDNISPGAFGPKRVYISTDGGATWQNTNFTALANEWISCVDVSVTYGGTTRDIAVGTRTGGGAGKVYAMQSTGFTVWADQNLPASDVLALKFSPTYPGDDGLVIVSSDNRTRLHIGVRDTTNNTTPSWDVSVVPGFPVELWDPTYPLLGTSSPDSSQIFTADLELPSDLSLQTAGLRRFYISTDATTANRQSGIYRVDDTQPHLINSVIPVRISSIAYYGTYAQGSLLAGEVLVNQPGGRMVNVWRAVDCTVLAPAWLKSDTYKSPTGGANSGYANAQLAWSPDGTLAYCGTSSACLGPFANPTAPPPFPCNWPDGYKKGQALDESAFSVSPYAPAYEQLLITYDKGEDPDIGNIWNQLSLIDTKMDFLSDFAVLEAPQTGEQLTADDYDVLYLFSVSGTTSDSIWRSTSDPLGRTWERILCTNTNDSPILRVKQTTYEETDRSPIIVFAEVGADIVGYSPNEGQTWSINGLTTVTDLALSTNTVMYILNNNVVYRYNQTGTGWVFDREAHTQLDVGHTVAVPLRNPAGQDMVLVGEAGPPNGTGRIAYVDFADTIIKAKPDIAERIDPPVTGDAHAIFDDRFEQDGIIYNAIHETITGQGRIYRWTIDKSTSWDEIEPPNSDFFGLAQRNDVLYGAWRHPLVPVLGANEAGVDRTLYPRANVPPPPDWDYIVAELPTSVRFTREPSSLKISSNTYNSLWAIDNRPYDFVNKVGLLWEYTDIAAKVGPFTTAPPSGSDIPVDPKTGRAEEINFAWRQISYSAAYELQVAKDEDFTNIVLVNENIIPKDQLAPSVYMPAGALVPVSGSNIGGWANIESGHTYYWRVRARTSVSGDTIRTPWSATMYFTVEAGLPTASPYPTLTLFNPKYGSRNVSVTPGFSWSAMPKTTKYEFILARDSTLQHVIAKANVSTTSYLYDGKLDYNTTYFWQVRALEPVVSDPSPVGTFTVVPQPETITSEVPTPAPIASWVWWIIALVTVLIGSMIAYAMVKPGYGRPSTGKLFQVESTAEKSTVEKSAEPILDKSKNPFSKLWSSIVMTLRHRLTFRKPRGKKEEDTGQDSLV